MKDLGALEQEWLGFISGLPVDTPTALAKRGLRGLLAGKRDGFRRALEDLDAALAAGCEDPRAYWARGILRLALKKSADEAILDLGTAVDLAPLHAGFHYSLGQALSGGSLQTASITIEREDADGDRPRVAGSALEEARLHLGLACDLDPASDLYQESLGEFMELYESREDGRGR